MSDLLKRSENEKIYQSFLITNETRKTFNILKKDFIIVFILIYFDSERKIIIETNVSKFNLAEILSQLKKKHKSMTSRDILLKKDVNRQM